MNKISRKFIIIGLFFIMLSASLFLYNNYDEKEAGKKSKDVLDIIKPIIEENHNNASNEKEQTININGYNYIGTISIPSLNLELPIMSEYTDENLKISPTIYYGSIYTNDLVICGHSYKTHFKYLNKLIYGDIIIITDINGVEYIYEVIKIEVLTPKEVSNMINSEFNLTLYTCTNDGRNRVTVRCNKVS